MKTRKVSNIIITVIAVILITILGGLEESTQQPSTSEHVTVSPLQP